MYVDVFSCSFSDASFTFPILCRPSSWPIKGDRITSQSPKNHSIIYFWLVAGSSPRFMRQINQNLAGANFLHSVVSNAYS